MKVEDNPMTIFFNLTHWDPTCTFESIIHDALDSLLQRGETSREEFYFLRVKHPIIAPFLAITRNT